MELVVKKYKIQKKRRDRDSATLFFGRLVRMAQVFDFY